jgi:hypothetical protein
MDVALGISLVLAAAGAILIWGVDTSVAGVDLDVVGVIGIVVGIIGVVMALLIHARSSTAVEHTRRRDYMVDR